MKCNSLTIFLLLIFLSSPVLAETTFFESDFGYRDDFIMAPPQDSESSDSLEFNQGVGSSGGGKSSPPEGITDDYSDSDIKNKSSITQKLNEGENVKIKSDGQDYSIEFKEVSNGKVTLSVYPGEEYSLSVGQSDKVDLNKDGYYDLLITPKSLDNRELELKIDYIHEKVDVSTANKNSKQTAPDKLLEDEGEIDNTGEWYSNREKTISILTKFLNKEKELIPCFIPLISFFIIWLFFLSLWRHHIKRYSKSKRKYWFKLNKSKKFVYPIRWQGWILILLSIVSIIFTVMCLQKSIGLITILVPATVIVIIVHLLLIIRMTRRTRKLNRN